MIEGTQGGRRGHRVGCAAARLRGLAGRCSRAAVRGQGSRARANKPVRASQEGGSQKLKGWGTLAKGAVRASKEGGAREREGW